MIISILPSRRVARFSIVIAILAAFISPTSAHAAEGYFWNQATVVGALHWSQIVSSSDGIKSAAIEYDGYGH